jgi:hypothetical protein
MTREQMRQAITNHLLGVPGQWAMIPWAEGITLGHHLSLSRWLLTYGFGAAITERGVLVNTGRTANA